MVIHHYLFLYETKDYTSGSSATSLLAGTAAVGENIKITQKCWSMQGTLREKERGRERDWKERIEREDREGEH